MRIAGGPVYGVDKPTGFLGLLLFGKTHATTRAAKRAALVIAVVVGLIALQAYTSPASR